MVGYSNFQHNWTKSAFACDVPKSKDYKVYVNGEEMSVYTCRISAYPFNRWWPDHQRQIDQTELVSYVNLVSDEEIKIEVEPLTKTAYNRILVKPYSKGVKTEKVGGRIAFTLKENGGYVFELDDYHGLLYIFNNKTVVCKNSEEVTYYFGAGVHFPGKIKLKSNESVYVDKDAYVYGCLFAEDAENIRIYGNGIFDDSGEERFSEHCYEPYTNGNIKFYDCKNVKIEGVGFTNSAIWCVNLFHCFDVEIDGVNVFGQWRYNTDGIDIVNSQRVTVRNSFVHSFDDTITVKGIDRYAVTSCTDILFENCILWCDWGKACEIGLETMCREYRNITFRNCDILRGGSVACDIQNGDCAEVHHIAFENIRIELEKFYTPSVMQTSDKQKYMAKDKLEIATIVALYNPRFREMEMFVESMRGKSVDIGLKKGEKDYASIHDILVKDITVYADEKVLSERELQCVRLHAYNMVEGSEFKNITIENIVLNGKRLQASDMEIHTEGFDEKELVVK